MPELPEVETVRQGLIPLFVGKCIETVTLSNHHLRTPWQSDFIARLTGRTVTTMTRRAKYLLFSLDTGDYLLSHLGMSGAFRHSLKTDWQPTPHEHVIFHLDTGIVVRYEDPRRFGRMEIVPFAALEKHPALNILGVEPLEDGFHADYLAHQCLNKRIPIKVRIMQQECVVGVGNIYASESLHLAKIHPARAAGEITFSEIERLVAAIKTTLKAAIAAGGSTLRNYHAPSGELGCFQHAFAVYGRAGEPCACGEVIQKMIQGGRSTFFCPKCQG